MLKRLPSPAMVVSLVALSLSMAGTGYAASTLARDSVGSAQLRAKAVRNADLARGAVTTRAVKDRSLLATDFKAGELTAVAGPQGVPGATGPAGATGPGGPAGPAGKDGATGAPGAKGATGPIGPKGLTGPIGPKGQTGATGPAASLGYEIVKGAGKNLPAYDSASLSAFCPAGKLAVGGGAFSVGTDGIAINTSYPKTSTHWAVNVINQSGIPSAAEAYVVCIND